MKPDRRAISPPMRCDAHCVTTNSWCVLAGGMRHPVVVESLCSKVAVHILVSMGLASSAHGIQEALAAIRKLHATQWTQTVCRG